VNGRTLYPMESPPPLETPSTREFRIPIRRLILHAVLFLSTLATTFLAGVFFAVSEVEWENLNAALTHPAVISSGLAYSLTLLTILLAHELGHYLACRYYGIRASLPYFIPAPPLVGIGTFGAFIRIHEPIRSRRALFDVGIAGPLAGFAFAVPAAIVGLWFADPAPPLPPSEGVITFNDPVLFLLLQRAFDLPITIRWNPVHFAAWVGMLATSLNLLPLGQLDGGHIAYALLGQRGHRWTARGIFLVMIGLAFYAYAHHRWAGWFVYVGLLGLLIGLKHPPVGDEHEPLDRRRKALGILALIVFILSFMPFPITIS
jgi:membrane-associated protease RseP (regulator of RpoE activity)